MSSQVKKYKYKNGNPNPDQPFVEGYVVEEHTTQETLNWLNRNSDGTVIFDNHFNSFGQPQLHRVTENEVCLISVGDFLYRSYEVVSGFDKEVWEHHFEPYEEPTKQPTIANTNSAAWAINQLNEQYRAGKLTGVMIQGVSSDGTFFTIHGGDLSYIEKLGLLEATKGDLVASALLEE